MLNSDIKKKFYNGVKIKKQLWNGQTIWGGMVAGDENYGFYGEVAASSTMKWNNASKGRGINTGWRPVLEEI